MRRCELRDAPFCSSHPPASYVSQVRFANKSLDFDWLLVGDDDTLFLIDNVVSFVRDLDPKSLLHISDATEDEPYGCTLPTEASERGKDGCIVNPPVTPCTRKVMEGAGVCRAELFQHNLPNGMVDRPGGTVFGSGQFGTISSRGLIDSVTEEEWQHCEFCNGTMPGGAPVDESLPISNRAQYLFNCYGGGDVRIGECFWAFGGNGAGIAPTVPYSRRKDNAAGGGGELPLRVFGGGAQLGGTGEYPNGNRANWGLIDHAQAVIDGVAEVSPHAGPVAVHRHPQAQCIARRARAAPLQRHVRARQAASARKTGGGDEASPDGQRFGQRAFSMNQHIHGCRIKRQSPQHNLVCKSPGERRSASNSMAWLRTYLLRTVRMAAHERTAVFRPSDRTGQ